MLHWGGKEDDGDVSTLMSRVLKKFRDIKEGHSGENAKVVGAGLPGQTKIQERQGGRMHKGEEATQKARRVQ